MGLRMTKHNRPKATEWRHTEPLAVFHSPGVRSSLTSYPQICHPEPRVRQRRREPTREGPMYFVYIMTNRSKTLYTGVTNHLMPTVREHKNGTGSGSPAK